MKTVGHVCPDQTCEEYRGFVRMIIGANFPGYIHDDDFFQEAWIGLWQAALKYEENCGAEFKTFAEVIIRRRCYDEVKRRRRYENRIAFSLNEFIPDTDTTYMETLPGPEDIAESVTSEVLVEQVIAAGKRIGLTKRQLAIMTARIDGQTLDQIGEKVGLCVTRVSKNIGKIKKAYQSLPDFIKTERG